MRTQGAFIHLEALDGIATVPKRPEYDILHGMLCAPRGRAPHQLLREGDLVIKSLGDRSKNALADVLHGPSHSLLLICCFERARSAVCAPTSAGPRSRRRYAASP